MNTVIVTTDPDVKAAVETGWVIETGRADLVDTGVCAMEPVRSGASASETALAAVRSLRSTLGGSVIDGPTANVLFNVLSRAGTPTRGRPWLATARSLLDHPSMGGFEGPRVEHEPESPGAALASLMVDGTPALAQVPRDILDRIGSWDDALRRLHWDDTLRQRRDTVVFASDDPAITDLNLYGLLHHAGGPFFVLIEDGVAQTVLDRLLPAHVARVSRTQLLRAAAC